MKTIIILFIYLSGVLVGMSIYDKCNFWESKKWWIGYILILIGSHLLGRL